MIAVSKVPFTPIKQSLAETSFPIPEKLEELNELIQVVGKKRLELMSALEGIQVCDPNTHLDPLLDKHVNDHNIHLQGDFLYWQETEESGSSFEIEDLDQKLATTQKIVSLRTRFNKSYNKYTTFLNRFCWAAQHRYPPLRRGQIKKQDQCGKNQSHWINERCGLLQKVCGLGKLTETVEKMRLELSKAFRKIELNQPNVRLDFLLDSHVKSHCEKLESRFLYWQETPESESSRWIQSLPRKDAAVMKLLLLRKRFHPLYLRYTTFLNRFCWFAKQGYPALENGEIKTKPLCSWGETNHILRRHEFNRQPKKKLVVPQPTRLPQSTFSVATTSTRVVKK